MNKIYALNNFIENIWTIEAQNISYDYTEVFFKFTSGASFVNFVDLKFGHTLYLDGNVISISSFPPLNISYVNTDQEYLVCQQISYLKPGNTYNLYLWSENNKVRSENTFPLQIPVPEQPYPSWQWDGQSWIAPVPYPSSEDYDWNEQTQNWVKTE